MDAFMSTKHWWIHSGDGPTLRRILHAALKASGFGMRKFVDHHFSPFGYSCVWLLSESHAALHTFPECNASHFELTSCVEHLLVEFYEEFEQAFVETNELALGVPHYHLLNGAIGSNCPWKV